MSDTELIEWLMDADQGELTMFEAAARSEIASLRAEVERLRDVIDDRNATIEMRDHELAKVKAERDAALAANRDCMAHFEQMRAERDEAKKELSECRWTRGRYPGKVTEHWMRSAFDRISTGEDEVKVLADYGYVQEKELAIGEAELAGIKERIAKSPKVKVRGKVGECATIPVSHDLVGKRVALVVLDEKAEGLP